MNRPRGAGPQARRRHWLSWATDNPLFGFGAVALIAGIIFVTVTILRDYVGPRKHVVVEFYDVNVKVASGNTTISLDRVTYQPGFKIRLSRFLRKESNPLVIVDGVISNHGPVPVVAFFFSGDQPAGVLVSRSDGNEATSSVSTTGTGLCPNVSSRIPVVGPGQTRRFNVSFTVERGSEFSWIKDEVRGGLLPALSFGPFTLVDCDAIEKGPLLDDVWRLDFPRQDLPDVELRDYYPFGAPTSNELSLNERRYWADWLPRVD